MHFIGERQVKLMQAEILEQYVDRVYAFAVNRTSSQEEAEELSQEILFTAVRCLPKLRDESRFEPWLWGLAENVTRTFRRMMGKQRAMYSYDVPAEVLENIPEEPDEDNEELYANLREKIAMLSRIYRDIVVLHYYDGLSVKQISEALAIPEGTITWRLAEARRKLKKEYMNMEETALRPMKINPEIYGSGDFNDKDTLFPGWFIRDALSQNILFHCYEKALTVEELAKLTGVPAYYIEDRTTYLIGKEALIEQGKGRYRTDFVIFSDKHGIYCEENAEKCMVPVVVPVLEALEKAAAQIREIPFYRAAKSEDELIFLYAAMAFDLLAMKFNPMTYPEIPESYDGYHWRYCGSTETGAHKRIGMSRNHCSNNCGNYSHTVYGGYGGFGYRAMMYDINIDACEDIICRGFTEQKDGAAGAIRDGYIEKHGAELFVTVPAFTKEQKAAFDEIILRHFTPVMEEYNRCVTVYADGYRNLFPAHLADDAQRMCSNLFQALSKVIIIRGQETGRLMHGNPERYCDVMVQWR